MSRRRGVVTSPTERRVIRAYVESGSLPSAAKEAGVTTRTAQKIMQRPGVLEYYSRALADHGLGADSIALATKEALAAIKDVNVVDEATGKWKTIERPDHRTRLIAADLITTTALKLREIEKSFDPDAPDMPENIDDLDDNALARLLGDRIKHAAR